MRRLLYIALNPYFQAFVVAGAIVLLLPTGIQKYYARQVDMITFFDGSKCFYTDLDNDGLSQNIQTFVNESKNAGLVIITEKNPYEQNNFRGIYQDLSPRLMIGDYNENNRNEVYLFTLVDDSVFLNAIEYGPVQQHFIKERFIARIGKNLKDHDFLILPGKVTDMTGDGLGDLVFGICAGFSLTPRNVYIYNIEEDTLNVSPENGAFIGSILLVNLDGDPFDEIILSTYASDNFNNKPVSYSDSSSWVMVLDHDLEFMFPPKEFPGPSGDVRIVPLPGDQNGVPLLIGNAKYITAGKWKKMLFIVDLHGNFKHSKEYGEPFDPSSYNFISSFKLDNDDEIMAINEISGFHTISKDLEIKLLKKLYLLIRPPEFIDIDQDSQEEILVLSPDQTKHIIYRNDFSHPIAIDFPIQQRRPLLSVKLNRENPPQLSVQGDQVWKLFDYGINPLWRFRFLIWLGIYLAVLGFIMLIRKLYSFQLKKRYETEKKIAALQLSSVKAQMEPHFIMNTISTIGSSIYRQKPDEAYQLLVNFSGMVRSLLLSSDKMTRSLREELDFVTNYLELEKSRFPDLFNYTIQQEKSIQPEAIIPKMVIQLHAENALKHGLMPKKSEGVLDIHISRMEECLLIIIKDNGIGRNLASRNLSQSTGKGMKILSQFFETYNKHNKIPLRQEIEDLFDNERNPVGTEVRIFVPVDFNKEIF